MSSKPLSNKILRKDFNNQIIIGIPVMRTNYLLCISTLNKLNFRHLDIV
jgi:hypothetical protein